MKISVNIVMKRIILILAIPLFIFAGMKQAAGPGWLAMMAMMPDECEMSLFDDVYDYHDAGKGLITKTLLMQDGSHDCINLSGYHTEADTIVFDFEFVKFPQGYELSKKGQYRLHFSGDDLVASIRGLEIKVFEDGDLKINSNVDAQTLTFGPENFRN